MRLSPKHKSLEPGYFTCLRPEIEKFKAINLAEGYTGFHCSEHLVNLVQKHVSEGLNQYGSTYGEMGLRIKVSEKVQKLYGHFYDPEKEVTITAGSTQAIFTALTAFIREGDEVIVFEPACENIAPAIEMNGGTPVFIPLNTKSFHIGWEQVQKMITTKTRMIIINTPHNPSGSVMNELDMLRLQKIISGTNILLLCDETFEHLVFDGESHQSVALYPKLTERSIVVSNFGETYHVTGWQTGYLLAPNAITKEIRKVQEVALNSVNTPFQLAFADFLSHEEEYLKLSEFYQQKRDLLNELLEASKFKPIVSQGSFFQLLDYSALSAEKDKEYAWKLVKDHGVAMAPISMFYHEKSDKQLLRLNFAQPDDILHEVAQRLLQVKPER
jgi:methionine aminotransferase